MAKVTDQNSEHPQAAALAGPVDTFRTDSQARMRPKGPREGFYEYLLWLWWNVLRF